MTQNLRNENVTEPEGRVSNPYKKMASKYRSEICEEQVGVLNSISLRGTQQQMVAINSLIGFTQKNH
jgi:hypothetical protein